MKTLKEKYMTNKGALCPHCGSNDLETAQPLEWTATNAAQETQRCGNCGREWIDYYTLTDVEFLAKEPSREDIAEYLLVAALEGGSNYWIEKHKFVTVEEDPSFARVLKYNFGLDEWKNGRAILIVSEQDSGEHFNVQPYDILASAEKAAAARSRSFKDFVDNHDADDADEVLQLACFSEIIYG
jgi:hypothetical protein